MSGRLRGLPGGGGMNGAGLDLSKGKVVGQVEAQPVSVLMQNPKTGEVSMYPAVCTHLLSDNAQALIFSIASQAVEAVLAKYGLITLPDPPPEGDGEPNEQAQSETLAEAIAS